MTEKSEKRLDTRLVLAGRSPEENHGIVNPPVYHASTVTFPTLDALEEAARRPLEGVYYGRYGTPTTFALEEAVAELEGADKCISVGSGLAAIAVSLLSFLGKGDHLLMTDSVYFPTRKLCDGFLARFGIETTYYDPMIGGDIAGLIRPETKAVFVEAPGSLTFEVQDIPAIAEAAHAADAIVIMDNTWSAGFYFQPFVHGVDVSVQAATKYIVGHSDAMLGTIATTSALHEKIKWAAIGFGHCAAPDDCYLGLRGLRSLSARLSRHQESGITLATWLASRPEVTRVLHPAFPECPGHEIWKRDFSGSSGLFAVELKPAPREALAALLDGLELFAMGYSWGGYESLIIPADPSKIRTAAAWKAEGPLVRINTGLEDVNDLIVDLEAGLARFSAAI